VAKGLKVPCLFMITEVSIRCQKKPGGWYTAYTRVYPPIHHCVHHLYTVNTVVVSQTHFPNLGVWTHMIYKGYA